MGTEFIETSILLAVMSEREEGAIALLETMNRAELITFMTQLRETWMLARSILRIATKIDDTL